VKRWISSWSVFHKLLADLGVQWDIGCLISKNSENKRVEVYAIGGKNFW
jgi:hypothetical protein